MSYTRKMIEKVRWYLDCYRMYFKINLLTVLEYKLDFLAINLASVLALLVGVFNIEIIFSQVDAMKMWSKEEVLWCLGFFYLVRTIYNTFFINTLSISYWIQNGKFDLFILKPLNTFFQLLSTGRYNAEYPLDEYLVGIFLLIRTSPAYVPRMAEHRTVCIFTVYGGVCVFQHYFYYVNLILLVH